MISSLSPGTSRWHGVLSRVSAVRWAAVILAVLALVAFGAMLTPPAEAATLPPAAPASQLQQTDLAAPQPQVQTAASEASGGGVYIVQAGDTLAKIAARYHTTIAALMRLNGIKNPDRIWVGQRLQVGGSSGGTTPPGSVKPPVAGGSGRWIDVNLSGQRLTAYQGNTPVFSTLISG